MVFTECDGISLSRSLQLFSFSLFIFFFCRSFSIFLPSGMVFLIIVDQLQRTRFSHICARIINISINLIYIIICFTFAIQ